MPAKALTQQQFEEILAAAKDAEDRFHEEHGDKAFRGAWSSAVEALPDLNKDVVYRVLSAMQVTASNEAVLARNRASVEQWLTASGADNPTPWKKSLHKRVQKTAAEEVQSRPARRQKGAAAA